MGASGVSKATKDLNLSEDVFAGMDATLRGQTIVHREYFQVGRLGHAPTHTTHHSPLTNHHSPLTAHHSPLTIQVGKGRDLGAITILQFFSKLSQGTAQMTTSRQALRLGLRLGLGHPLPLSEKLRN